MIFRNTAKERGLWRGWLRDGQSLEVSWPARQVTLRIGYFSNDDDRTASRYLLFAVGLVQAFIPLGIKQETWPVGDEPQWGFSLSREFGILLSWGSRMKEWDWPFRWTLLEWAYEGQDGEWLVVTGLKAPPDGDRRSGAKREVHPYVYKMKSGKVQRCNATIFRERWTHRRHLLSRLGWPKHVSYSIDVAFDGEVGERSGSWKSGTTGCGYSMLPTESPQDTLRRMERERRFT